MLKLEENKMLTAGTIIRMALNRKRELVVVNIVGLLVAAFALPVPFLLPTLVDEVVLEQPGITVSTVNSIFPEVWHGPVLYVAAVLVLILTLHFLSSVLSILGTKLLTIISKDIVFSIRKELLIKLENEDNYPFSWKTTGKVGHWNHEAHKAIAEHLAELTIKYIGESNGPE